MVSRMEVFTHWFQLADSDRDGRLTGPDAVQFFNRSGLPRHVLSRVWALADSQRQGFLDMTGFEKAMDLITLAQSGAVLSAELYGNAKQSGELEGKFPMLEGVHIPGQEPSEYDVERPDGGPNLQPGPPQQNLNNNNSVPGWGMQPQQSWGRKPPPPGSQMPAPAGVNTRDFMADVHDVFRKRGKKRPVPQATCTSIIDGLKQIYFKKIRPIEEAFKFGNFFSPYLTEGDFVAKPSVLLLGQYSTGKTTFVKHLLGKEYPGCHIGPEPTTDRFVVVMHGPEDRTTPGNTLAVMPDKPYQGLSMFGTGFLGRFMGAETEAKLLEEVTIVDTPGVLSGEKQRIERQYDFIRVNEWFATRCDIILLLFDPYKLDISDEFKAVIQRLRGHDDKVRVVLNKADQVDAQQLMRVYGALMWSLGKVFKSPEVCRVYMGSFNAGKEIDDSVQLKSLFEAEQKDLFADLLQIPQRSCDRKVNEFVKRMRAAKIHVAIMGHLRKMVPMFGKAKWQEKVLQTLDQEFVKVQREHQLPPGDFPDVNRYRDILAAFDIASFPKLDHYRSLSAIDDALTNDVPALLKAFDNPF
ncbi:unnamed protein product [Pedinophyceae sp. YPF-701]|nr:unnamed protein product [Pedinophyceae sp. YPF-701]